MNTQKLKVAIIENNLRTSHKFQLPAQRRDGVVILGGRTQYTIGGECVTRKFEGGGNCLGGGGGGGDGANLRGTNGSKCWGKMRVKVKEDKCRVVG